MILEFVSLYTFMSEVHLDCLLVYKSQFMG
jgi:hypothetical protein